MGLNLRWSEFGMSGGGPPVKARYKEATVNGRRGRVVREEGDKLFVAFYATGDTEVVNKSEAAITVRKP